TVHLPDGEPLSIYDAAMKYQSEGIPTVIFAGKEYGTGSSRDWAAKGPRLQGVRAVIAESFERIHRSNLVGMGIAPLEFLDGQGAATLGLTGYELVDITGLAEGVESGFRNGREVSVRAKKDDGRVIEFKARVRLDTPQEVQYYRHGGILHYVLRQLLSGGA
ncbi:MAG TPA: aconitate hydratase, partial [Thermoanaerobaculia bacterium]|nr:aconitate hydratase [Thermoanaerobaculia bacterium]